MATILILLFALYVGAGFATLPRAVPVPVRVMPRLRGDDENARRRR
jgi:hypothetical protein